MSVFIEYDEPKTIKKVVAKPDMKKFGPLFKGDSPKIKAVLDETDATIIKDAFESDGTFKVEVDGKEYELTEDLVSFEEKDETIRGEKIFPHECVDGSFTPRIHCYKSHSSLFIQRQEPFCIHTFILEVLSYQTAEVVVSHTGHGSSTFLRFNESPTTFVGSTASIAFTSYPIPTGSRYGWFGL